MEILYLKRYLSSNIGVLGNLSYNGELIASTLERPWEDNREGTSCIPLGEYLCEEDTTGVFKWWALKGVPNRAGIELHQGNRIEDTKGCILVGRLRSESLISNALFIGGSVATLTKLKSILPKQFILRIE